MVTHVAEPRIIYHDPRTSSFKATVLILVMQGIDIPTGTLELEQAGPRLGHPGLAVGLIVVDAAVVPEGGTADDVGDDEEDEDDDVDDGDLPPALLQAGQHPGLARVAGVAELALVVAPQGAVPVGTGGPASYDPHRLVLVGVTALVRGLTASGLQKDPLT